VPRLLVTDIDAGPAPVNSQNTSAAPACTRETVGDPETARRPGPEKWRPTEGTRWAAVTREKVGCRLFGERRKSCLSIQSGMKRAGLTVGPVSPAYPAALSSCSLLHAYRAVSCTRTVQSPARMQPSVVVLPPCFIREGWIAPPLTFLNRDTPRKVPDSRITNPESRPKAKGSAQSSPSSPSEQGPSPVRGRLAVARPSKARAPSGGDWQ
jgi:hypothetical protein